MPTSALATFAVVLSSFRGHVTAPTFVRFVILALGWILAADPSPGRCVTEALIAARVSGSMHWEAFHRFFSRGKWDPDALGRTLLRLLQPLLWLGWVELALDDTVAQKRGKHVFGASMHVDAVTSTTKRKNLVRGHCWVVLGVVVDVPWSKRPWFVPLLFRLYQGKKEAGSAYRTKSALGREMVDKILTWIPAPQRVRLLLDSGYMNRTMMLGLPLERVTVVGSLQTNAALFRPLPTPGRDSSPKRRGRRRKKGARMPTPAKMQHDRRWGWTWLETSRGDKVRRREVLSFRAQWYGVLGERIVHMVLVREDEEKLRVVLCTDPTWSARQVVEQGARRWSIEVWNRDAKQVFGFADSPAWSEKAVLRTAPWVGILSGIVVVWFHRLYEKGMATPMPERPWYTWKEDLTFADLVRAAQETLRSVDALGWAVAILLRRPSAFEGAAEEKKAVGCRRTETLEKARAA
jgi:DDE superfamily endonuclease